MITEKKKYLIENFVKKTKLNKLIQASLDTNFSIFEHAFPNISPEKIANIKNKYNLDEYIKRIIPVLNDYFTEEELMILIEFYSTSPGKKMNDEELSKQISKSEQIMISEIEKEFQKTVPQ